MAESTPGTAPIGRPRRFDDETERALLIEAALRVMAESEDGSISVAAVLAEAGLSTRAFYRHFDSKEALAEALMIREAAAVGRSLARVVAQAPDPVAAVQAWLDRFLDIFYNPQRARRAAGLVSATDQAGRLSAQLIAEVRRIACAPLTEALRAGHETGLLHSPVPEADAFAIHALVGAYRQARGNAEADRASTEAYLLRFVRPALGLAY